MLIDRLGDEYRRLDGRLDTFGVRETSMICVFVVDERTLSGGGSRCGWYLITLA